MSQAMNESFPIRTQPFGEHAQDGEAQQLISTFLTNISDEFRTPLAALNACVEYLLGDFDSLAREEINELLRSIHLSVTGLSTLIENLIQSANIDAGHLLIRTGAIDLGVVVSEAIDFMRPLINRRCQQVIVEQPSSLLLVSGDPARLTQVMVNLLSNASKFGPMNQTIGVVLEDNHQNEVRVRVVDQGSGFLPEEQEKVIDFFLQPVSESNRPYGNALAIAVARKIVEEHGGTMGVEQRPGDGMNFWFTVPTVQKYRRG